MAHQHRPPHDPPTDPSTAGYGAVPTGWADRAAPGVPWWRQAPPLLLVAVGVLLVVALVLLVRLLAPGDGTVGAPAPATTPVTSAPALPDPTFTFVRGGYRYSIGVGAFAPAVSARGSGVASAPPGRHFLTASIVIRNDQQDRGAPAPLDSNGTSPRIWVGLGDVASLPPVHSVGLPVQVSDCDNDPRNPSAVTNPDPVYRGLGPGTCIVRASVVPAWTVSSLEDDSELPPGGIVEGVVTSIDLPDDVPTGEVSVWLSNDTGASPDGPYAIFDRIG